MNSSLQTLLCGLLSLALASTAAAQTKNAGPAATPAISTEVLASNATPAPAAPATMPMAATVLESAYRAKYLSRFSEAVAAAGLNSRLSSEEQQVTVLAPANPAFKKLPEGTMEGLLDPKNQRSLKLLVTYHIIPGRIPSADLVDGAEFQTVNGEVLKVEVIDDKIYIGGAQIMLSDVESANGVTHVIDKVLFPSSQ
jgi:uncharacterized surface protein with fasciclin (FAS1) repeats